jgi:hypothetical protein
MQIVSTQEKEWAEPASMGLEADVRLYPVLRAG